MQHRLRNRILALVFCWAVLSAVGATNQSLVVERARTRVGIARVVLNVAPLVLTDGGLVGDYSVRVPLAPFMDHSGTFEIPLTDSFGDTVTPGNTLQGTATNQATGHVYDVACTIKKSSKVRIVVTTPKRVLSFEAPYSVTR